jgi:hypothetical protein
LASISVHRLTTIFLQLPQDCTNAFRVYRLDRIPADFFETVQSTSYSFFLESLHRLNISGFCISQVAIKLPPRTYGHSKMRLKDIAYSVRVILQLAWRTRSNRTSMVYAAPRSGRDVAEQAQTDRAVTPPRCARQ